MNIYTKTGDSGTTSLAGGTRVEKCHPRVSAYGDIDELISHLGLLRCEAPGVSSILKRIQTMLMYVSATLASNGSCSRIKPLDETEIHFLESEIDLMTAALPQQKAFVIPGGSRPSALCHIARTVCRRAERSIVSIPDRNCQDELALKYVNRLSDYLFTLGRKLCLDCGGEEEFWVP